MTATIAGLHATTLEPAEFATPTGREDGMAAAERLMTPLSVPGHPSWTAAALGS